jgi:2,4-dichlorophenol 6-monooxygenase
VLDTYDDWARAREVSESGCVLVRPDTHVGWRSHYLVENPRATLAWVMETLLGHAARREVALGAPASLTPG